MTFLKNGQASNEADILIGALAGTHIHWLKMKDDKKVSSSRSMNGYARFRDVRQAADGKIYALTESPNRFVLLKSNVNVFVSVEESELSVIESDVLYPNPMVRGSVIDFHLQQNQQVSIKILDLQGKCIEEITSKTYPQGKHSIAVESEDLPQGVYFIEIDKGGSKIFLKSVKL